MVHASYVIHVSFTRVGKGSFIFVGCKVLEVQRWRELEKIILCDKEFVSVYFIPLF